MMRPEFTEQKIKQSGKKFFILKNIQVQLKEKGVKNVEMKFLLEN